MLIQIKSDLHLEFRHNSTQSAPESQEYIHPEAEVLVLAGDIINSLNPKYILEEFKDVKIPILYVPGNHEYYGNLPYSEVVGLLNSTFKNTNIRLLNPGWEQIDDVIFVGATLWTDLSNPRDELIANRMGEIGQSIPGMTTEFWHNLNIQQRQFIENTLGHESFTDMRKVVITHYLPSVKSVPKRFIDDSSNVIFVNNCEDIMSGENAPVLWIHGHTHDSCDYTVGGTRVVCNPYGYWPRAINKNWDNAFLVEI